MPPELHLAVQYAVDAPELPRWRVRRWVQQALLAAARDGLPGPALQRAELTIRFVDADEGRMLNHDFRGRDYATNVLTFEYGIDPEGTARGDVVVCLPVLQREAREQQKPLLHHAAHLVIHGVFHALGYDHETPEDADRMEKLETTLLATMRIPDPYVA